MAKQKSKPKKKALAASKVAKTAKPRSKPKPKPVPRKATAKPRARVIAKPKLKPKPKPKAKPKIKPKPKPKPKPKAVQRPKPKIKAKPKPKPKAVQRPKPKIKAKPKPKPKAKPKPKIKAKAKPKPKPKAILPLVVAKPRSVVLPPRPPTKKVPPPRKIKRVVFDAKTLRTIREGLEVERLELEDQLAQIDESTLSKSQSEWSGETGDEDYADAGTATFERERDLSIRNNIQDLLDKISKAQDKISAGTYGLCESCGEPISAERLKALPHVLMCIRCKKQEERR